MGRSDRTNALARFLHTVFVIDHVEQQGAGAASARKRDVEPIRGLAAALAPIRTDFAP